jgi:hypothetical protein
MLSWVLGCPFVSGFGPSWKPDQLQEVSASSPISRQRHVSVTFHRSPFVTCSVSNNHRYQFYVQQLERIYQKFLPRIEVTCPHTTQLHFNSVSFEMEYFSYKSWTCHTFRCKTIITVKVSGVPLGNSEVYTKLSRIPSSVENTSVTT